jgi:putative nucleotidyltransferase with HDIG domain/diguanylate cyclase (GGDEF)-like protein
MSQNRFNTLSIGTKAYVTGVVIAGALTVLQSFYDLTVHPIGWNWTILAVLTLVSGSATVRLPSLPAAISVSETFVFTSVLLFGSAAGTLTVALDALVISFWSYRKGHPPYKIVFNVCALPLTIWIAAHVFFLFPSIEPLVTADRTDPIRLGTLIGPLLLFTVVYFSLNSWIITFAISLERRLRPFTIWRNNFLWLSLNYFGGASVAALLVSYTRDLDLLYLAVIIPLLIVLYFTFSMSMGRVEDANKHLMQLNTLYMSTIETLAMAIDAKDQITHGHIRRVQTYAVALAKEVGVTDTSLIKAVEAAALLHDMGKLAVPEYILNKPGPLTVTEFDKMKLHASVGADILSSIGFPYPVVPIVRHHHENWNGTGYPDGISGTNIPIGARILSVVDCFDALTSDRPYRPRLSDKDALEILIERRGSMYDPLIVDTFLRVYDRIVPQSLDSSEDNASLVAIAEASANSHFSEPQARRLDEIAGSTEEMLTLFDLARGLTSPMDLGGVGNEISRHLRRLIPCSTCIFFIYDPIADELVAAHASGDNGSLVSGLKIGLGQRLSGWVAANRRSIRNSDPVLDFGEAARAISPRPRSCLSTPLLVDKELIGVLTLYSTGQNAFTEEHERVLEAVARQAAPVIKRTTIRSERVLPSPLQLHDLSTLKDVGVITDLAIAMRVNSPTSILLIHIKNLFLLKERHGSEFGEQLLNRLIIIFRQSLRSGDLLFRRAEDEFVVLLGQTDLETAQSIGNRIQVAACDSKPGVTFTVTVGAWALDGKLNSMHEAIEHAVRGIKQTSSTFEPGQGSPPGSVH